MNWRLEKHRELMLLRPLKREKPFKKIKLIDAWLWAPYKKFIQTFWSRKSYQKNLEKNRSAHRENNRRWRKNQEDALINSRIAVVYWHEVHRPNVPIGQYMTPFQKVYQFCKENGICTYCWTKDSQADNLLCYNCMIKNRINKTRSEKKRRKVLSAPPPS
jgi:hypothetical protein